MTRYDLTILTDRRYVAPENPDAYKQNILTEDSLIRQALEKRGLRVARTNWDNPDFDWAQSRYLLFRTTWDYFDRFEEFSRWLESVKDKVHLLNPLPLIYWNLNKNYLQILQTHGISIPPTIFLKKGDPRKLGEWVQARKWKEWVLKPAISGAGRHTYKFSKEDWRNYEKVFNQLLEKEPLLLQEFQERITSDGEIALMLFQGKFSHAVLKKAKAGEFRVQDDFGGTVHPYSPTCDEIKFAEECLKYSPLLPVYARVDMMTGNDGLPVLSELELIEPELWLRKNSESPEKFADAILDAMRHD